MAGGWNIKACKGPGCLMGQALPERAQKGRMRHIGTDQLFVANNGAAAITDLPSLPWIILNSAQSSADQRVSLWGILRLQTLRARSILCSKQVMDRAGLADRK